MVIHSQDSYDSHWKTRNSKDSYDTVTISQDKHDSEESHYKVNNSDDISDDVIHSEESEENVDTSLHGETLELVSTVTMYPY